MGINCTIPSKTIIGRYVMMGPNCFILQDNHVFIRTDIPMCHQGHTPILPTVVEDDVWIGRDVLITPGRTIKRGSIVAAGCVLCKNFPEYSVIGGNPSKLIRSRIINQK
nr:acyltransferase [Bacteroides faecis]